MTLRIAIAVVGLALSAGIAAADHGNDGKLPKPIDSPIVRPKLREGHKVKARVRTNPYERISWGSEWKLIFHHPVRNRAHYLR